MTPAPALPFDFVTNAVTDVGCVRTLNEDHVRLVHSHDELVLAERGVLLVVADGMGGHLAGEVASQVAVDSIHRTYYASAGSPREALITAFTDANRAIHDLAERDGRLAGMGTTGTALALCGDQAFSANVGDSRIYLVRDERIYRMTADDSAVHDLVAKGLLTAEEARHHADKNVILRALGTAPEVTVASWEHPFPLRPGDRFLLCSDGLHDVLDDEEIRLAMVDAPPAVACERLIELARARGGPDNISAVVAEVKPRLDENAATDNAGDTREMRIPS